MTPSLGHSETRSRVIGGPMVGDAESDRRGLGRTFLLLLIALTAAVFAQVHLRHRQIELQVEEPLRAAKELAKNSPAASRELAVLLSSVQLALKRWGRDDPGLDEVLRGLQTCLNAEEEGDENPRCIGADATSRPPILQEIQAFQPHAWDRWFMGSGLGIAFLVVLSAWLIVGMMFTVRGGLNAVMDCVAPILPNLVGGWHWSREERQGGRRSEGVCEQCSHFEGWVEVIGPGDRVIAKHPSCGKECDKGDGRTTMR